MKCKTLVLTLQIRKEKKKLRHFQDHEEGRLLPLGLSAPRPPLTTVQCEALKVFIESNYLANGPNITAFNGGLWPLQPLLILF